MAMNRSHEMADRVNTLDVKHVTIQEQTWSVGELVNQSYDVECECVLTGVNVVVAMEKCRR